MTKLFHSSRMQLYFNSNNSKIIKEINGYSDNTLLGLNANTHSDTLAEKFKIGKLVLDKEGCENIDNVKKVFNHPNRRFDFSQRGVQTEFAIFKIPFNGDKDLFLQHPIKYRNPLTVQAEIKAKELIAEITENTIFSGNEKLEKQIVRRFEEYFSIIEGYVNAINSDIDTYNAGLSEEIKKLLAIKIENANTAAVTKSNLKPFKK
ncbi:hypothetical protein [Flavobacterium cerinum]|uniref:Uncharacterized protein n=1 Tax=Flavobacterium cerinum TaxID=2502784 RepID=A0A444HBX3_9FLAO|nr:hypothetical protein [Flavobacterium cerinum]RWX00935.1 hypothetical protein EPI11_07895 [Flavobacterium cerinum]